MPSVLSKYVEKMSDNNARKLKDELKLINSNLPPKRELRKQAK